MANKGEAIRDFFVKLGFDPSDVTKGLAGLDKEFSKFQKKLSGTIKVQQKSSAAVNKAQKETNKLKKDQLSIERLQLQLRKKLEKIKNQGGDNSFLGLHNTARSKDPLKLKAGILSADRVLALQEKNMTAEKKKQVAKNERLKALKEAEAKVNKQNAAAEKQRLDIAKTAAKVSEHQERLRLRHMRREDALLARRIATTNSINKAARRVDMIGSIDPRLQGAASDLASRRAALEGKVSTARTASEFAKLRGAISRLNDDTTKFIANNKRMQKEMSVTAFSAKALKDSFNNLARSYVSVFAVIGGGAAGLGAGQELTAMRATLLGVSGDAKIAAEDFEFVKETSMALGVSITEATSAYSKLGAAARAAGISTEDGKEAFLAAAELATAFQLSEADFQGVSRAMSQIAS